MREKESKVRRKKFGGEGVECEERGEKIDDQKSAPSRVFVYE